MSTKESILELLLENQLFFFFWRKLVEICNVSWWLFGKL